VSTVIPVTLLYGGILVVLLVLLGTYISLRRLLLGGRARLGKPIPDELVHAVRAHGNAAEWVPIGMLALLMLELAKAPSTALHVLGGSFTGLRLLHAGYALNGRPFWLAVVVAVLHYCVVFAMGAWAVWLHFH
jgi:uncharacterized membrane protein YecN with MAPEG domain